MGEQCPQAIDGLASDLEARKLEPTYSRVDEAIALIDRVIATREGADDGSSEADGGGRISFELLIADEVRPSMRLDNTVLLNSTKTERAPTQ